MGWLEIAWELVDEAWTDAGVRDLGIIALQKMENESKEDSEASELREQTGEKEWKRFQAKV